MFSEDMIAEERKFNEVRSFLEGEIVRLNALIEEYKEDIKTQGRDFNMDNPNGGMYSGMELTEIHHDMQRKMFYSQQAANDIAFYQKLKDSPYFARVDFKIEGALKPRTVYIGLKNLQDPETFEIYVCDWRAPIASLFYEDFEDKAFFDAPKGRIYGDLLLKRQYKFKDGCLYYYVDSDVKIDDEILRDVLSSSSGEHLKVIVNSIQREQNKAVRYTDNENLLVVGPAGSGKTSVGFHRLAFLLYRNRNEISSAEIVMLSNNDIFSSYVADIIPELGEMPINYASFYSIFAAEIPTVEVSDYYALADEVISGNKQREACAAIKMSTEFMAYIEEKGQALTPQFADICYKGHLILSADALLQRYLQDGDSTAKNRGERVSMYAQTVIEEFFFENKKMVYAELDDETSIDEDTGKLLKKAKRDVKAAAVEMIRHATIFDPVNAYFNILAEYARVINRPELTKTAESLQMGYVEFEDALGIVFLKTVLGTAAVLSGVKHILIDEAQDFSLIQHEILKKMFPQARVTLLADTNQAIVEGINTVNQEQLAEIYGAKTIKLNKSYRSTEQINEFAVSLLPENAKYEIFKRSGEPVSLAKGAVSDLAALLLKETQERPTLAVITKTANQARELHKKLVKMVPGLRLCDNKSCEISNAPVVMPLALTKGLEFDCVVVFDDEGCFTNEDNEKYLYLASTRALHKLNVFTCKK